jgi:hypothetical protein
VDLRSLTVEDINERAEAIEGRLRQEADRSGSAATIPGTEDDDWLKLRGLMQLENASRITDLHPRVAAEWVERMERHARER